MSDMTTKNIIIVGVGGQGTLFASRILGQMARHAGYDVKVSEVHGMAQRGGSVVTYVRYGGEVFEPLVEAGGADILIAFEQLEALRYVHYLKKDGLLILNEQRITPVTVAAGAAEYPSGIREELSQRREVVSVDAIKAAAALGNVRVFNIVIIGLAAKHMEFAKEDWLAVIGRTVPAPLAEINRAAFEFGYQL